MKLSKQFYKISFVLAQICVPVIVFASEGDVQSVTIQNPLKDHITSLPQLINSILSNIIMPLAAVYVVVMIIYAGFKYITAQGNAAKIKDANQGLLFALIGAAVLLGAAGIAAAVQYTICGQLISCGTS